MKMDKGALFETFTFKNGMQLRNKFIMAPMTNYSSSGDGLIHEDELTYYGRRAKGVGAVITAAANVTIGGKAFRGQVGCYRDDHIPSLRKIAETIQAGGAKAVLQIFHGGRMCPPRNVPDGDVTAPSAIPFERDGKQGAIPRELSMEEIEEIIEAFGQATVRAIKAGFDGVEIHGANGYLIQQFFSPHSNRREDDYGGSLHKRMTFPIAVIESVQRAVKEYTDAPFIVGYRFSPEEPETTGITMVQTLEFVDKLSEMDLDYLHVSLYEFWSRARRGADSSRTRIDLLLEAINERVPLIGVGSIRTLEDAKKAIDTGIDLIALGRALLVEPEWVQKAKSGQGSQIETLLDLKGKDKLDIPQGLWKMLLAVQGWFPDEMRKNK